MANIALSRGLAVFEAKHATGLVELEGRHVSDIGLVARDGRRRVFAGEPEDDLWEEIRADTLAQLAREALTGRTATVFEARALNPLFGRPTRSIDSLAVQFGVQASRIYKIMESAKSKIMDLIIKKAAAKSSPLGEACPTCGRIYGNNYSWASCKRGYSFWAELNLAANIHPECLPQRWRRHIEKKIVLEGGKHAAPAT
jgi:hypothetical protein